MTPEGISPNLSPETIAQLHDIRGLDAVSPWPLAPGWWLTGAALLLSLVLLGLLLRWLLLWWRMPKGAWHRDGYRRLQDLQRRLPRLPGRQAAAELSELLRRIAIARCGREACAGLSGDGWLEWLSAQDPKGFDWRSDGRALLELPYAPPAEGDGNQRPTHNQLRRLLRAAIAWTTSEQDGAHALRGPRQ